MLCDSHKRAVYDQFGHAGLEGGRGGGFSAGEAFGDIFGEMFGDIFSGGQRGRTQVFRGADLRYELELDLEQAVFGTETEIHDPVHGASARPAKGTGAAKGSTPEDLRYLQWPGSGPGAAVDLHHPTALSALQGPRQDHLQSLRYLLRPGSGPAGKDPAGQSAGGRRYG